MNLIERIIPIKPHYVGDGKWTASEINCNLKEFFDVLESNIAKLEASAVKVYGKQLSNTDLSLERREDDTHQAYLIAIEPIVKAVSLSEVIEVLRGGCGASTCFESSAAKELADRIESHGIERGLD